jgi:prepilin-type N-terminal cleavage/methylation domain-containing protein
VRIRPLRRDTSALVVCISTGSAIAHPPGMMNGTPWSRTDGFSLVEVMVACAVLTIALLAAAHVLMASGAASARSRTITEATMLAVDKLEYFRALPIDDAALQPSPPDTLTADVTGYSDRPHQPFTRRWSIELLPSFPDDGVVVRVVVLRPGEPSETVLETIKVRKPTGAPSE